ncbi:MAG: amidophosphoribosyltransferase [archaeon]
MEDDIHEECGIAAVFIAPDSPHKGKVVHYLYRLLLNMQNRGQLSAGITTYNPDREQLIDTYKNLGMVNEVFKTSFPLLSAKLYQKYSGDKGIGHVRYATCGKESQSYAQPFERHHGRKWKWFAFGFNGNIANYSELRDNLLKKTDYHLVQKVDTEILMHYIAREMGKTARPPDPADVFSNLAEKLDGSYCIAFINADGHIIVARDPIGNRPLCYGEHEGVFMVASESNALTNLGVSDVKDVPPGHLVQIDGGKPRVIEFAKPKKLAHCMFEWVYFANVASELEGRSVYMSRTELGKELAKIETEKMTDDHVVVPVPDSAKSCGDAYAYALGVPSMEGLIRNRFVGRTFIESKDRLEKVRNKFTVIRKIVEGKKVMLVDDSIVRGTTTKSIVRFLKEFGRAKEVHIRVSCPPIMAPCFYGIDMSTVSELFARKFSDDLLSDSQKPEVLKAMADDIGAESIIFQSVSGLVRSIQRPKEDLCLACLNGQYCTAWGKKLYALAEKDKDVGGGCDSVRTYERSVQ